MKMGASDGQTHAQAFGGTSVSALEERGAVDDDGCDDGGRVVESPCRCAAVPSWWRQEWAEPFRSWAQLLFVGLG